MQKFIPIFPLSLVVFPQSRYPLYIFEPRYKLLIEKCLDEKTGFGIISLTNSEVSKIGCYVDVSRLVKKFPSGEMDIIVTGKYRFLREDLKTHSDGYHIAEIKKYNDIFDRPDLKLLVKLRKSFTNILKNIDLELDKSFWNNYEVATQKSFKLAEKSGLSLEQQLELLSLREENRRIKFLLNHFNKFEKDLEVKGIVLGDGYIN
jgi:Lon protease-like protein